MDNTIKKLKENRLMELDKSDYENIENNAELHTLFLSKIKEGQDFSIEYADPVLEDLLFHPEYITIIFDQLRKQRPEDYINIFFYSEEDLEQEFPPDSLIALKQYKKKRLDEIIEILKESPESSDKIEDREIIEKIIENKIEQHYGAIYMPNPTEEFENLLLNALEHRTYKRIYTVTDKIIQKCQETDQLSAAVFGIDLENEAMTEIYFAALEDGKITYGDLSYAFKEKYKKDLRLIKHKLHDKHCYFEEGELERVEVRQLILSEIENNHDLATDWAIRTAAQKYPEIAITVIKYYPPENLKDCLKYSNEMLENTLKSAPKETIDAILYNLEHNLDDVTEIFEIIMQLNPNHPEKFTALTQDTRLLQYIIPKIPMDLVLKYLVNSKYDYDNRKDIYFINEENYKLLSELEISFTEVPKKFIYSVNYPENVWLALLPVLKEDELTPNNIDLNRFKDTPTVLDAIIKRLVELKSNRFNSTLEYWGNENITPYMIEIITSKENPLNLSIAQRIKILPSANMANQNYLYQIIKNTEKIDAISLQTIIPTIQKIENKEEVKRILNILFEKEKIEINANVIQYFTTLASNAKKEKNQEETTTLLIYEAMTSFLKTKTGIPLSLTIYFDQETRKKATYSKLEDLKENPNTFLVTPLPDDFLPFIKECQKIGIPIDLKIINQAYEKEKNQQLLDYNNIVFTDDKDTYNILNVFLVYAKGKEKNEIHKKIVTKWMDTELSPQFFNCQTEWKDSLFLDSLLNEEEYLPQIIQCLTQESTGITFTQKLLFLLIKDYSSEEIANKVKETIYNLITQNKISSFIPDNHFKKYLEIDNKIFTNYLTSTFINNINNITTLSYLETLLNSPIYKQPTLDALYQNSHLISNQNVLSLLPKNQEIKQYFISILEDANNPNNRYLEFDYRFFDKDVLLAFLKNHSIDAVITHIVHQGNIEYITKETNEIINKTFLEKHPEYKKEAYELLNQFYGTTLLTLLETDNIKKLLAQEKEVVQKYIEIFKERQLDEGIIMSINDSFRQNCFNLDNLDIINFYTNTLEKIQRGITEEEIQQTIQMLLPVIPNKLEEEIEKTGNEYLTDLYHTNKEDFLRQLIIELSNNQNIYAPLFNKITNNLIIQKRNEHRKKQNIYADTNLKYELETKSLYNALFNYLVKNKPRKLMQLIRSTTEETELDYKTLCFLYGKTETLLPEELPEIKKNIPRLKAIIIKALQELNKDENIRKNTYYGLNWQNQQEKKFSNLPREFEYLLDDANFMKSVKKIPIYPTRKTPIETIGNINMDVFLNLVQDQEKYNALLNLLNKYKFLEWGDLFEPTVKKLALGEDAINIYNFINAFSKIYDNERKIILRERKRLIDTVVEEMRQNGKTEKEIEDYIKAKENEPINIQITAYKILKYNTIYSSIANYYKLILGLEDFDFVKKNDGPNTASKGTQEQRLQETTEMQIELLQFDKVTIPSFIHQYENKEKKKLQVIIGNRADSRNLTHGERTGACMRSYGHADTLFKFCNTDPRGFHFTFVDPETNEYVSRVSGFRNGNTIFLNQLRNSVSTKYTNEDVIDACKSAAEEIIKRSQTSSMPIENVVASPCYALAGHTTQVLSESNIGQGVYTGYKDVSANAVVLATTGQDGKAVDVKLDGENQPVYDSVRLQPREYTAVNNETKVLMQRISGIKHCIEHSENKEYYKTLDLDYELLDTEYIHVIIGQDWYVSLDSKGNLAYDIAIQSKQSTEELNEALEKMNKIKEEKIQLGGFTNGI